MKKNLFFHFSVLAMLIVLISACSSKKPEYTNVIPSDASQVIAVNLKSLADKAGTKDKETKEALQKLTDALKSDMNAATFQQLEAVSERPLRAPWAEMKYSSTSRRQCADLCLQRSLVPLHHHGSQGSK